MKTETKYLELGQSHGFFAEDLIVGNANYSFPDSALSITVGSPGSADRSKKLKVGEMMRYARADSSALYEIRLRSLDTNSAGNEGGSVQVTRFDDSAMIAAITARTGWESGR